MNEHKWKSASHIRWGIVARHHVWSSLHGRQLGMLLWYTSKQRLLAVPGFFYLSPLPTRIMPRPVKENAGDVMASVLAEVGRKDLMYQLGGCW